MKQKNYKLFYTINAALSVSLLILSIILYCETKFFYISLFFCINVPIQYYLYRLNSKKTKEIRLSSGQNTVINACFIIPLILSCSLMYLPDIDAYSAKGITIIASSYIIGTATASLYALKLFKK